MSPEQRRYLVFQGGIGAAIVNALLNAGLGWGATRALPVVPVWGIPGVVPDFVATAFGVSFGTVLVMAFQVPWEVSRGKIAPFPPPASLARILAKLPRGIFARGVLLGTVSVPLFAAPVIACLSLAGPPALSRGAFIAMKAALSAVEGGLVTPLIIMAALGNLAGPLESRAPESSSG